MKFHVYSPVLEAYVAMDLASRTEAAKFIGNYPDRQEAKQMTVVLASEAPHVPSSNPAGFPRLARF